jgi:hypothetical protein
MGKKNMHTFMHVAHKLMTRTDRGKKNIKATLHRSLLLGETKIDNQHRAPKSKTPRRH